MKYIKLSVIVIIGIFMTACSNNTKKILCTIKSSTDKYSATSEITTTFESESMIHTKLYIEKEFINGNKAEEDNWTIENKNSLEQNTKEGMSGNINIKNNIAYLTINYDFKKNPELIKIVTSHTEFNDYLSNMEKNGYSCQIK